MSDIYDEPVCVIQSSDNRAPRIVMKSGSVWRLTGDGMWAFEEPIPGTAAASVSHLDKEEPSLQKFCRDFMEKKKNEN